MTEAQGDRDSGFISFSDGVGLIHGIIQDMAPGHMDVWGGFFNIFLLLYRGMLIGGTLLLCLSNPPQAKN